MTVGVTAVATEIVFTGIANAITESGDVDVDLGGGRLSRQSACTSYHSYELEDGEEKRSVRNMSESLTVHKSATRSSDVRQR